MKPLYEASKAPVAVEAISGACMLAKRTVVEEIGCFSTDYFMYLEDMDLCIKVTKTGSQIYYVPDAVIVHHGGGSSSLRKENNFSNIVLRESLVRYFQLHRGHTYASLYRISAILTSLCRIVLLAAMSPIAVRPAGYQFLSRAARKWWSIFAWSLGFTTIEIQHPLRTR
jgi:GT2 family glycosyltransferase